MSVNEGFAAKPWRTRYRWWLILPCLAAVAVISWSQLSGPRGRFTREQYDRIRLGMTPAEIASSIGSDPSPIGRLSRAIEHRGTWHTAAWDESNPPLLVTDKPDVDVWADEYAVIEVRYLNGKAVVKTMDVRLSQAQGWLRWLRRHVGW